MDFFRLYVRDRSQAIELIKHSPDSGCLSYVSPMGYTVFHLAAEVGDLEFIDLIFEEGVKIPKDEMGKVTPLRLAVYCGHTDVVKCLIENTNQTCISLSDALNTAFSRGNIKMIDTLLECHVAIELEHLYPALKHNPEKSSELSHVFLREITKDGLVRSTDNIFSYEECRTLAERCAHRCVLCIAIEIALHCRCPHALRIFLDAHDTHPSFSYDNSMVYPKAGMWFYDKETTNRKVTCAFHGDRTKVMSAYLMSLVSGRLRVSYHNRYTLNIEELIDILIEYGASMVHPFPELKRMITDAKFGFYYAIEPTPIMLALVSIDTIGEDAFLKLYHILLSESSHSYHPRCFAKNFDFVFMGYATYGGHIKVLREVLRSGMRLFSQHNSVKEYGGCKCHNKNHFTISLDDGEWFLDSCIRDMMDSFLNMSHMFAPRFTNTTERLKRIVDVFMEGGIPIHFKIKFGRAGILPEKHTSFLELVDDVHRNRRDLMYASATESILKHIKTYHHHITLRRLAYMHSK